MGSREAVLYEAHFDSPAVRRELARLVAELGPGYDVYVTGYCQAPNALAALPDVAVKAYGAEDLTALPYPAKVASFEPHDLSGNCDLPLLRFFADHPDYDRYWVIEYDVRLSGRWSELFADLAASPTDLLATSLLRYADFRSWYHWHDLVSGADEVPLKQRVKGFLPFCRVSAAAIGAIDRRYRAGWGGHPEVAWPTIVALEGLSLEDIGAHGDFTPQHRRGRYYAHTPKHWSQFPGTFVYRPVFADTNLFNADDLYGGNVLWHPVKE